MPPPYWAYAAFNGPDAGFYISEDFTFDPLVEPTWRKENTGLANSQISIMRVDPFEPVYRQYCQLSTGQIYRRHKNVNSGAWVKILDGQRVWNEFFPGSTAQPYWIAPDPAIPGRLYSGYDDLPYFYYIPNATNAVVLISDDYGDTWYTNEFHWNQGGWFAYHGIGPVEGRDGVIWASLHSSLMSNLHYARYVAGEGWEVTDYEGYSGFEVFPKMDPHLSNLHTWGEGCITPDCAAFGGAKDLVRVGPGLAGNWLEKLKYQDGLDLGIPSGRSDKHWISPTIPGKHRYGYSQRIYTTSDDFANVATAGDLALDVNVHIVNIVHPEGDESLVAFSASTGKNIPIPVVCALPAEDSVDWYSRSGANYAVAPYTDSISGFSDVIGQASHYGLWVGNAPRQAGIYTHAVELNSYGPTEGIPLHGDRGVWEIVEYPNEHARDIAEGLWLYHNNPAAPPAASGAVDAILTDDNFDVLVDDNGSVLWDDS